MAQSSERAPCPVCGWWTTMNRGKIPYHHQRRIRLGKDGAGEVYKTNDRCPGEGEEVASSKEK
jgi:hypothetical protein